MNKIVLALEQIYIFEINKLDEFVLALNLQNVHLK